MPTYPPQEFQYDPTSGQRADCVMAAPVNISEGAADVALAAGAAAYAIS